MAKKEVTLPAKETDPPYKEDVNSVVEASKPKKQPEETDDDDFDDNDEHILSHGHIKKFGLKLNKAQAMELQPHVSRIAQHGLEEPELIEI